MLLQVVFIVANNFSSNSASINAFLTCLRAPTRLYNRTPCGLRGAKIQHFFEICKFILFLWLIMWGLKEKTKDARIPSARNDEEKMLIVNS